MIKVSLPDGSQRELPENSSVLDLAKSIGSRLAKSAVAGKVNGIEVDVTSTLNTGDSVEILTAQTPEGLDVVRHSCAHVLAMAIQDLFPGTQITIGPVIENQFYYDVLPPSNVKISVTDFPKIEKKMAQIAKSNIPVTREVVSRKQAEDHFAAIGEYYKVEIIKEIPEDQDITIYKMGEWGDLCRGPHIPSSKHIGHFKLLSISGSYWRGDASNQQLVRIYGTAWSSKKELDDYLFMLEEAKKRDHVVLGKQLELYTHFSDYAVGAPTYLPDGAKLFNLLVSFMRRVNERYGFKELQTPQVMDVSLWHTSGHYDHYKENMYFVESDDKTYAVKPMNCPGHVLVYGQGLHSYRTLPVRYSEFGVVHRHELHGAVRGLTRVRRFTQDDAHSFISVDQVHSELLHIIKLVKEVYRTLDFDKGMKVYLSTRPEDRTGDERLWDKAEEALVTVLKDEGLPYEINEGDGAFYGPKIDFCVKDSIGRYHQTATIQLDFQMPSRFKLKYITSEDKEETPVMIHRAVLGSVDRFIGVFIEHCAGHFPIGLAPVQVRVVSVNEKTVGFASEVSEKLRQGGVRVEDDFTHEKLGYKIRQAQLKKRPYMVIIGNKEMETNTISARFRDGKNLDPMPVEQFVDLIKEQSQPFWGLG